MYCVDPAPGQPFIKGVHGCFNPSKRTSRYRWSMKRLSLWGQKPGHAAPHPWDSHYGFTYNKFSTSERNPGLFAMEFINEQGVSTGPLAVAWGGETAGTASLGVFLDFGKHYKTLSDSKGLRLVNYPKPHIHVPRNVFTQNMKQPIYGEGNTLTWKETASPVARIHLRYGPGPLVSAEDIMGFRDEKKSGSYKGYLSHKHKNQYGPLLGLR